MIVEDCSREASQKTHSDTETPPLVYRIKTYKPASLKQTLSFMLIRPPRFIYNEHLLVPPMKSTQAFHIDTFDIPFKLTLYRPKDMRYVVLYLHGNSSSRFEGYLHLKELPPRVGLACFDFAGCGLRFQADYITLGLKESKEVNIAANFLKEKGYRVVGWGRSMGSVSLLLSEECDIMVADSPFSSLNDLCKESSKDFLPRCCCCFFYCLFPCVYCCIKSDIMQKAQLDPNQLQIVKKIQRNEKNKKKHLFVIAGNEDRMIPSEHAQRVYEAFPGKKRLSIFEGTHNSNRPEKVIRECFYFIENALGLDPHPSLLSPRKRDKVAKIFIKSREKIQDVGSNEETLRAREQNSAIQIFEK